MIEIKCFSGEHDGVRSGTLGCAQHTHSHLEAIGRSREAL